MQKQMDDHQLARKLAEGAGQLLIKLRNDLINKSAAPWVLQDLGDLTAHQYLAEALALERPDDTLLSEEGSQGDYSQIERVWIVDPLDGTREFGEFPRDDWAVHVALVVNGKLTVGAVAIPERGQVFSTADPPKPPERIKADDKVRIAASRTRPGRAAGALCQNLDTELLPMGSAGVKTMAIVEGTADVYAHSGGQKEWDSAAPVAVARSAGLWTSRLDGSELTYNNPDPFVENFIICRPELSEICLAILKQAGF